MSSLRNEALLETIYDEVLEELEQKEQFRPLFTPVSYTHLTLPTKA